MIIGIVMSIVRMMITIMREYNAVSWGKVGKMLIIIVTLLIIRQVAVEI